MHLEKNANILVFITHHTKNVQFIEESVITAMIPFENITPITLDKQCEYFKLIEEVVKEIKNDVIEVNKIPIEERKNQLKKQDAIERKIFDRNNESKNSESDKWIIPFMQAYRSIEIVGQIIKNRKGSLKIDMLIEMITELYKTGFRMVGYLGDNIKDIKDQLKAKIEDKVTTSDTSYEIEMRIQEFLNIICLQICFSVFSRLVYSLGVKELKNIYNEVARKIGTPAAKIVSFSINTYYGKINIKELELLAKEFEHNPVAFQILRARVKHYVYNNYVDYRDKQRIAQFMKMKISPQMGNKLK
jgi:hypothetical protein